MRMHLKPKARHSVTKMKFLQSNSFWWCHISDTSHRYVTSQLCISHICKHASIQVYLMYASGIPKEEIRQISAIYQTNILGIFAYLLANLSPHRLSSTILWGNLLKRVQCKKIYEILKYCCCAPNHEFNNTAWALCFKKYPRASSFLHNHRVLVTFMIMSRRNVLLFFWHCFWKRNEILCFQP